MKGYKKSIVVSLLMLLLVLPVLDRAPAETGRRPDVVFVYSTKAFPDVDIKDATAALKIYADELGKQIGYRVESHLYDGIEAVVRDLQEGTVDFVALSSIDYLRIRNRIDVELGVKHMKGGKGSVKYLLLTRVKSGYKTISDLRNKKLTLLKGNETGVLYLNTLLQKLRLGEMNAFFSPIEEKIKPSQAVLAVFFGQADACIVTDLSFKTMVEMNPQLGKDLGVLSESQELVDQIAIVRTALSDDVKQKALSLAGSLKNTTRGRQVLLLFKIDDIVPMKERDLAGISDLVGEYERLRARR
jgi:ABC-type phosphate/phosphonate transport system substrate-binding protein